MRTTLLALALVLVACGRSDRATTPAHDAPTATNSGPDQLVFRIPREGGAARVFAYPQIDSVVWSARERVPSARAVLAFDENAGSLVLVDARGAPVRIDTRLGGVTRQPTPRLTQLASADGWSVFGIGEGGRVVRLTPLAGEGGAPWSLTPPAPASRLIPQPDGSLLVVAELAEQTRVFRLRPPDTTVFASTELPKASGMTVSGVGDRAYFLVDSGLVGLRPRDLESVRAVPLRGEARAVVTTPSGDRIYVTVDEGREISVVDRYRESVVARIALPGAARELRMDPTGRLLLARPAQGDSIWVVSLATDRVVGTAPSVWRADLPAIAPDGAVAVVRGADVALLDPQTLAERTRVRGGSADVWHFFSWSGFRVRTTDPPETEPVFTEEPEPDDTDRDPVVAAPDTVLTPPADRAAEQAEQGFLVQFAALRSEEMANEVAQEIRLEGAAPRVVLTRREGVPIYRVLAGPYETREEAERVGRESGRSYWVYEGVP